MGDMDSVRPATTAGSIVIPAHNEGQSIGRLLDRLLEDAAPDEWEIVVVCNGCTDDTASVARRYAPAVRVVELAEPSKQHAIRRGDEEATKLPRIYVDADVRLGTRDVRALVGPLRDGAALASAPERDLQLAGVGMLVRAYYDVWLRLPQVRSGLFGRGAVAVSADGFERVRRLPPTMSDDLAFSEAFGAEERIVIHDARVAIWPPRTMRDLIRRRIRVYTGNAQLDHVSGRSDDTKTSAGDLVAVMRGSPVVTLRMPVFVGVAVVSKLAARRRVRRGDFTTWLRDESSRQTTPPGS
jgi:glycosyltransferase involved in cell wall biosynthesis